MQPVVIFLSPHLDDAVFSCPARILAEVCGGAEVIIATVFTRCGLHHAARSEYQRRRREDQAAARVLGARPCWLGMRDAPFRHPLYHSFQNIVFGTAEGEETPFAALDLKLLALIAKFQPVRLYIPLGVGGHIDHRLTFAAASRLFVTARKIFYEERPYAFVGHAVPWRLSRLGIKLPGEPFTNAEYWRHLLRARYVRSHLPPGSERRLCRQSLDSFPASSSFRSGAPELHSPAGEDIPQITEAVFAYSSQTPAFLGPTEEYHRASRVYARRLGSPAIYTERYWRLSADGIHSEDMEGLAGAQ
jgi:LmbE family N-acetylglucosaminyl deacetylase